MRTLLIYRHPDEVGPYSAALAGADVSPDLVPADADVRLDGYSGLILMGGTDVNPALYGEERHPETDEPDTRRDEIERALVREAVDRDLPVLAICRGMQLMNVAFGGTLIQHLPSVSKHKQRLPDRGQPVHKIQIEAGTLLHSIAGRDEWDVNSRHHQAVDRLAEGFRISARDPEDHVIEAIERPGRRFVLGVQWHPENQAVTDAGQQSLFAAFRKKTLS